MRRFDKWGLTSLRSERFDYVAGQVDGYCLDVGCGEADVFVKKFLNGDGKGIDVYRYPGLAPENIVEDMSDLPFPDEAFECATFIANINHIPEPLRDVELSEAHRCLKPSGKVIVTMGNPVAEVLVHKLGDLEFKLFGRLNEDTERHMGENEDYYLLDSDIVDRLSRAGFGEITRKYFSTQWGLNHLFVGIKR